MRTNCFDGPVTVTESAGKRAWAPKTLPVRRWQARQWQTETRTGSAVVTAESWPQEQEAVRVGTGGLAGWQGAIDLDSIRVGAGHTWLRRRSRPPQYSARGRALPSRTLDGRGRVLIVHSWDRCQLRHDSSPSNFPLAANMTPRRRCYTESGLAQGLPPSGECTDHDVVTVWIPKREFSRSRGGVHSKLLLKCADQRASSAQRVVEVVHPEEDQ
jgi:hypothetical protein